MALKDRFHPVYHVVKVRNDGTWEICETLNCQHHANLVVKAINKTMTPYSFMVAVDVGENRTMKTHDGKTTFFTSIYRSKP